MRPLRVVPVLAVLAMFVFTPAAAAAAVPPADGRLTAEAGATHVVRAGDTLSGIARRYAVSVPALLRANSFRSKNVRLRVGARVVIPAVERRSATSSRAVRRPEATPSVRKPRGPETPALARRGRGVRRASLVATPPRFRKGRMPDGLMLAVPDFADVAPAFTWPIEGSVSSLFGRRRMGWHRGIDIVAAPGAPITAVASGLVVASGTEGRYGHVVKIAHENGFTSVYAHNTQNLVELGDWISAGQTIATVGRTGRATSEHVHFELRREGLTYNPLYLLPLPPRMAQVEETVFEEDDDDHE